jgi:hypothetical protein
MPLLAQNTTCTVMKQPRQADVAYGIAGFLRAGQVNTAMPCAGTHYNVDTACCFTRMLLPLLLLGVGCGAMEGAWELAS